MNREEQQKKTILRVAVVTSFITTFMGSALNLSIPDLEDEFHVNAAQIGWVVTAYTLAVAALSVPLGKVADVTGRRRIFLTGVAGFAVFSLACAFAGSITVLLILRVLQGIVAAMIFATNNAILISAYPGNERGRVLGLATAGVYVGLSCGPVVGGLLNNYVGWRSIFIVACIVTLFALYLGIRGVPKTQEGQSFASLDIIGNLLYVGMIVLTMYGLTNLSLSSYAWAILVCGIVLGVLFVVVERKAKEPVIRVTMFSKDPVFTLSNIAALLNYGATFAISYLMSIYLQVVMGYSSQIAGIILISQPIMQAAFSPMMGKLSDRIAPYKLASAGMGICAAGLVGFALLTESTGLWLIIPILMASGFGFALFSSPNTNAIMACVDQRDYSVANSILATMRTVGHSSSMAIVTIVVGLTMGNQALAEAKPAEIVNTMHVCFIVFIILCVAGIFMSLKRRTEGE